MKPSSRAVFKYGRTSHLRKRMPFGTLRRRKVSRLSTGSPALRFLVRSAARKRAAWKATF